MPKYPEVKVNLPDEDVNVLAIIGRCRKAARNAGLDSATIDEFYKEATSGDYDHLLQTCLRWFDCS